MNAIDPETHVSVDMLGQLMRSELAKMRHMFSLSFYVLCTSLIVLLLCVHRVSFIAADAPLYFQLQAEGVFQAKAFRQLESPKQFFPWLRSAMLTAARSSRFDQMRVLDLVALRQIRMYTTPCVELGRHQAAVDPLTQWFMDVETCIVDPQEDPSGLPESFGVNGTFGRAAASHLSGFSHIADFHNFDNSDMEYLATLRLGSFQALVVNGSNATLAYGNSSSSAVNGTAGEDRPFDDIDELEAAGFLDELTSGVAVDTLVLYPQQNLLVIVTFIMETTTTGYFTVDARSDAFQFFVSSKGIIFVDTLIFLCFLMLIGFLSVDLHERYSIQLQEPNPTLRMRVLRALRSVGVWEFFTFALVIAILTVTGMRLRLWNVSGTAVEDASGEDAFNLAAESYFNYKRIYELYCVSLVLVVFRLFYTFRYIAGLSKITNTLRASAPDLARVALLWSVLLLVFTISGCMIFGRDLFGLRTFGQALVFLMTILVSAQLDDDDYRRMYQSQGTVADTYLIALFVIFWLLLLNLVIAIISSSFLNDTNGLTETTTILELFETYVGFTNRQMYAVDRVAHSRHEVIEAMPPTKRVASRGLQIMLPLRTRFRVLLGLRMWRLRCFITLQESVRIDDGQSLAKKTISYGEVLELMRQHEHHLALSQLSSASLIAHLFVRAQQQRGAILNTVAESADTFVKILDILASLNSRFDALAREVRRYRNISSIGGGGGGGGNGPPPGGHGGFRSSGDGAAQAAPAKKTGRKRGMSLAAYEALGDDEQGALQKDNTFSIHNDGDVVELDSNSDIDSEASEPGPIELRSDSSAPASPSPSAMRRSGKSIRNVVSFRVPPPTDTKGDGEKSAEQAVEAAAAAVSNASATSLRAGSVASSADSPFAASVVTQATVPKALDEGLFADLMKEIDEVAMSPGPPQIADPAHVVVAVPTRDLPRRSVPHPGTQNPASNGDGAQEEDAVAKLIDEL